MSKEVGNNIEKSLIELVYKFVQDCLAANPVIILGGGRLTFKSEFLEKRRNLIDYVVLHELLHIKVPNHGKLFKGLMFAFFPDWEKCSNQLKEPL